MILQLHVFRNILFFKFYALNFTTFVSGELDKHNAAESVSVSFLVTYLSRMTETGSSKVGFEVKLSRIWLKAVRYSPCPFRTDKAKT